MPSGAANLKVKYQQGQKNVIGTPTARGGVVGVSERGPIGVRTSVTSAEAFLKVFGGIISDSAAEVPKNVQQYFDIGGTAFDFVRICHYTDITNPASYTAVKGDADITNDGTLVSAAQLTSSNAQNWALNAADTVLVSIDGAGDVTVTFDATPGSILDTYSWPAGIDQDGKIVNISIDGGPTQSVTFSGVTTALSVAIDQMNTQLSGCKVYDSGGQIKIESDKEGTNSSVAYVAAGSTSDITWASPTPGGGDVGDIKAVTGAEAKALFEADLTPDVACTVETNGKLTIATVDTGIAATIQVNSGTAVAKFGFDTNLHTGTDASPQNTLQVKGKTEGAYANALSIVISAASNGNNEYFDLVVTKSGVVQETWKNLTMDQTALRYCLTIVNNASNGSNLIALIDYDLIGGSGLTALQARPKSQTWGPLANGTDGLTSLADTDFIGSDAGKTGLYALDSNTNIKLVGIPGRSSAAIHAALNAYVVHRDKECYVVHPTPTLAQVANTQAMETFAKANLYGTSEFATISWPRIAIPNPNQAVLGTADNIYIDPSMSKMGKFAYNDRNNTDGVFVSTAGVKDGRGDILNCVGLETDETEYESNRDLLADVNVEPIVKFEGTNYHWDGGDNLKTDGDWPRQWHARGAISIVTAIKKSSLWTKHSKNNQNNREIWQSQGERYLGTLPIEAFDPARPSFFDVSEALNTPEVRANQEMKARLGLGFSDDAKWVTIIVTRSPTSA